MIRRQPRSKRTDTLFPYTTLFRSRSAAIVARGVPGRRNPECDVGRDQGGLRVVPLETEFAARLAADTTTFAFCWRVVRFDGVALGFTSHDRDLEIEGLIYRSAPGIAPSAVHLSAGLETDSMDVTGALSADEIGRAHV